MENFVVFLAVLLILTILLGALSGAKSFGETIRRGLYLLVFLAGIVIVIINFFTENPQVLLDLLTLIFNK